jgi:hypothetical protein
MWDVQNQFVLAGENGGLASLVFFILIFVRGLQRAGSARRSAAGDRKQELLLWALGVLLFSHAVAAFGIDYFDQIKIWWFASLAMVSAATAPITASQAQVEADAENEVVHDAAHYGLAVSL